MKRHSVKKYFTLLEVMVSMGVFCLLMLALMQFFTTAQGVWEKTGSRTELFDSARMLNQMLQNDLASAFYGDNDLDMNSFRFFRYTAGNDTATAYLTFAAQRTSGLTAVNYRWDPASMRIYLTEVAETNTSWANSHWVTDPDTNWISALEGASVNDQNAVLDNVIYFNLRAQNWEWNSNHEKTRLFNETRWISQRRPPALVIITYAVISQDAMERIGRMAGITTEADIRTRVRTVFGEVFNANGKFIANSLDEGPADLPQRQLLHDNTQIFNIVVPIER